MVEPIAVATNVAGWLWENYGRRLLGGAAGAAKESWSKVKWKDLEKKYKKKLLDEHSTTKLLGNPKEIKLDKIYTDVYILDEISAFRRLDFESIRGKRFDKDVDLIDEIRRPLLQIAKASHRLYILGKPGAGKSTFLKSVVRLSCEGKLNKTVIFVPLKRWSDGSKTIEDFIANEFSICDFPDSKVFVEELLRSGGALILFDGLDEVSNVGTKRREAIDALTEFSRRYVNSQIFLTCRTAATEYSFDKFTYVEIADFTKEQQQAFIAKWYSDRPECRDRLLLEWHRLESKDLVDLARTPLLLALLCLAYDSTLTFPRRRIELYEEAVNALLRKWDSSREISRDVIYKGLSHNRKEQMLRRIAFETFKSSEILIRKNKIIDLVEDYLEELPPDDVHQGVDGEAVIKAMEAQHGLIVERAHDVYSFSHLTIHEYFTAKKLVDSTKTEDAIELLREHAVDDQWREVVLMVASILDDGRFLIDAFVKIMHDISIDNPKLLGFVDLMLKSREESRSAMKRYGVTDGRQVARVDGDAAVISECCVTIAGNMRVLKVEDEFVALPRLIAASVQNKPSLVSAYFSSDGKSLTSVKYYFRLAALVSECLNLTALPDRKVYLRTLLNSIRASSLVGR